jgi:1-acyl-sn-glycerol-3-phosphate acyltransferase
MRSFFHSSANRLAALLMKVLFGSVGRVRVLHAENADHAGGFLLAANHISHFDPFIISSVVRRKIDWMAMDVLFSIPFVNLLLRAVDAFPANRQRADRATIRIAINRLKSGHAVGLFPEGGIRDGLASLLEGAPLRRGATTLAHLAEVPLVPCVIIGSDRLYAKRSWLPVRSVPVWVGFGKPIAYPPVSEKSAARESVERRLADAFKALYVEMQQTFQLTKDDLPHSPRQRMRSKKTSARPLLQLNGDRSGWPPMRRSTFRSVSAAPVDSLMCLSMNVLQLRHRLHSQSRDEMERYVEKCERLTAQEYYSVQQSADLVNALANGATVRWRSPVRTGFAANNIARADFFSCSRGRSAPTVLMLHALMSATHIGYRRWAARFNELGWNACFVHLPYHYSRVPRGYWNGELAITADLIRNAEALRQGVMEVRQLMAAMREHGCREFGLLGTSYGGWIGALLAMVERDFRFVALMTPIVNVDHAIWQSPVAATIRRRLARAKITPSMVARHFHLSSPIANQPLCSAERVLFVAGKFDSIVRPEDIEAIHTKWRGSDLLHVPQGHFGYRVMRETIARLKERGEL